MNKVLDIYNLNYAIDNKVIFNELKMTITEDSVCCILGGNNSGKTTLLKIIAGFLKCNCEIVYNEEFNYKRKKINNYIGFSFYRNKKIKSKPLVYFLMKKLKNRRIGIFKSKKIINEYSTMLEINDFLNEDYNTLNELEKVKFNILYSIISKPKIVVLDDIFEYLTFEEYCYISNILKKIVKELKISIIYTSKKLENSYKSDIIFFLNNGCIELEGTFDEISKHDNMLVRNGIVISQIFDISLKLQFYDLVYSIKTNINDMVKELWK